MAKTKPAKGTRTGNRKPTAVTLTGGARWKAWLDGLAAKHGAPVTVTIDQALRELAERLEYAEPPPRY